MWRARAERCARACHRRTASGTSSPSLTSILPSLGLSRDVAGALERRREGERQLGEYVESEARDLAGDAFQRFLAELYKRIQVLMQR